MASQTINNKKTKMPISSENAKNVQIRLGAAFDEFERQRLLTGFNRPKFVSHLLSVHRRYCLYKCKDNKSMCSDGICEPSGTEQGCMNPEDDNFDDEVGTSKDCEDIKPDVCDISQELQSNIVGEINVAVRISPRVRSAGRKNKTKVNASTTKTVEDSDEGQAEDNLVVRSPTTREVSECANDSNETAEVTGGNGSPADMLAESTSGKVGKDTDILAVRTSDDPGTDAGIDTDMLMESTLEHPSSALSAAPTKKKVVQCPCCDETFPKKKNMREHLIVHGERPYKCAVCNKDFKTKQTLVAHRKLHIDERLLFTCQVCNLKLKTKASLQRHEQIHMQGNPYKCQFCGEVFRRRPSWQKHERTHTGQSLHTCKYCGKGFNHKYHHLDHEKIHTEKSSKTMEKPFKCDICDMRYASRSNFIHHKATHEAVRNGNWKFKCTFCGKGFIRKSVLKRHELRHSGTVRYNCQYCGKGFLYLSTVRTHERSHRGEQPFKCQWCGMKFMFRHGLVDHERKHTGEKPFVCSFCGRTFSRKLQLGLHERTHTGELLNCRYCSKKFNRSSNRTDHERVHTGEKPYKCPTCSKAFSARRSLINHKRTHVTDTAQESTK